MYPSLSIEFLLYGSISSTSLMQQLAFFDEEVLIFLFPHLCSNYLSVHPFVCLN